MIKTLLLIAVMLPILCNLSIDVSVPTTACVGDTLLFYVSASGGDTPYSYYWYGGNDTLKAQANVQNPVITIPVASIYTITCTVFDKNGCNVTSFNNVLEVDNCK